MFPDGQMLQFASYPGAYNVSAICEDSGEKKGALPRLWMRPMLSADCIELLRQLQFSIYFEGLREYLDAGVRLASSNRDGVLALGDDGDAVFGDHAQVARL